MKLVIQRVTQSSVTIDEKIVGTINQGLMVLIGLHKNDSEQMFDYFINKMLNLRIFYDKDGKMNNSLLDISGDLLLVSQFTLYGNCKKGNRPSFTDAMRPELAEPLYDKFIQACRSSYGGKIETGEFGGMMSVSLVNDGPITIVLEKENDAS